MRTFFHSVALIKSSRRSSSASASLTRSSSFHQSSSQLDRSACEVCPLRDSCKGRKEDGGAGPEPDDKQSGVEKEVVGVAVPCTVKNAGPLYETLTVVGDNNDQETTSTGTDETQRAEQTTEVNSTRNQQRLQELDKRIKALAPSFWRAREPEDVETDIAEKEGCVSEGGCRRRNLCCWHTWTGVNKPYPRCHYINASPRFHDLVRFTHIMARGIHLPRSSIGPAAYRRTREVRTGIKGS